MDRNEEQSLDKILSRMSSSLSLDQSSPAQSLPEHNEDKREKKIIPIGTIL